MRISAARGCVPPDHAYPVAGTMHPEGRRSRGRPRDAVDDHDRRRIMLTHHRPPFLALIAILAAAAFVAVAGAVELPTVDWVLDYNGPDSDDDLVTDTVSRDGFLYLTGHVEADNSIAYVTAKYAVDGTVAWVRLFHGAPGSNRPDQARGLAVDDDGNVYVTGWSTAADGDIDATTLKYSPAGDLLWERRQGSSGGNAQAADVMIGADGHVYVSGAAWVNGGFDGLLVKYDRDGNLLWSRTRDGGGGEWDSAVHLVAHPSGDIVVGGYTEVAALDAAWWVLRYTAAGDFVWDFVANGFATSEEVEGVSVDPDGNIYVVGELALPGENQDLVTAKLSPAGGLIWEDGLDGGGPHGESAAGLALTSDGDVVVAGKVWEPAGHRIAVRRLSADGEVRWTRYEDAGYAVAVGTAVAVDADGNAYVTGYGYDSNNRDDWITARYAPDGTQDWLEIWAAPEGRSDRARAISVSGSRVHVVGRVWRDYAHFYDIVAVQYDQETMTAASDLAPAAAVSMLAYPNPFNPATSIRFDLPRAAHVVLDVLDLRGRRVTTLVDERRLAGEHTVTWRGRDLAGRPAPAGAYLLRLQADEVVQTSRVVLVE
ncbi:hypothetical protein GF314_01850 [bacterium]|nr:hypothetical protein [bacterium]